MSKYTQTIESIDPSKAEKYLKKNVHNRYVNEKTIALYAKQMREKEWRINGESLIFSDNGELLDGQHRLSAIVASGVTLDLPVFRGVEKDAIRTINTGKPRSIADHLRIHGFPITYGRNITLRNVAAAVTLLADFADDNIFTERKVKITPAQSIEWLENNPDLFVSAKFIGANRTTTAIPVSILIAMHYKFKMVDHDATDKFFISLFTGANLRSKSPVLALRNKLLTMPQDFRKSYYVKKMLIAYLCRSFGKYLQHADTHENDFKFQPSDTVAIPEKAIK